MTEARRLLASVFGFAAFRPGQEEIVAAVEAGPPSVSRKSLVSACNCMVWNWNNLDFKVALRKSMSPAPVIPLAVRSVLPCNSA
jgi:hypothetical protein